MSFSKDVKNEILSIDEKKSELISMLSGIIRSSGTITKSIVLSTENINIINRVLNIIKELYYVSPSITIRKNFNFSKKELYIIEIKNKCNEILEDLSIMKKNQILTIPDEYIYADEYLLRAYIRGCFIGCGSVTDPKTSRYHLEFILKSYEYSLFLSNMINKYDLDSKVIKRSKYYMVYIKQAEKISDFLKLINANNAVLYYENIRIYRENVNNTNRLNNCEIANIEKSFTAANNQINDINIIMDNDLFDLLDDKIKETCLYRLKYNETTLTELSEIISFETGVLVTKSGLNHRFRKIKSIADEIRNKER